MTYNIYLKISSMFHLLAAIVLIFIATSMAQAAFIIDGTSNTLTKFDPILEVNDNGRRISVTGTVACTTGEKVQIHVSITQSATGAVAEGNWKGGCTSSLQTWGTDAVVQGSGEFEAGDAQGVGLGVTSSHGKSTDAIQWLNEITLMQQ